MRITEALEPTDVDINHQLGAGENGIWAINSTAEPFELFRQAVDAGCVTNADFDNYFRISDTLGTSTQAVTAEQYAEAVIIDLDMARRAREVPYLGNLATAGN